MLAAMVAAGTLPPVAERVSDEPLVVQPLERIGKFGGQLNVTMRQEDSGGRSRTCTWSRCWSRHGPT